MRLTMIVYEYHFLLVNLKINLLNQKETTLSGKEALIYISSTRPVKASAHLSVVWELIYSLSPRTNWSEYFFQDGGQCGLFKAPVWKSFPL